MKLCTNPECPVIRRLGRPVEYADHVERCSDCARPLVAAAAVEPSLAAPPGTGAPRPLRQLLVTLLAPLALLLVQPWVLLPGVDTSAFDAIAAGSVRARANVSVFALGLVPLLTATLLVEICALAVPRWRPLRIRAGGRRRLAFAALALTAVLAALQAFFIARWLESVGYSFGQALVEFPGWRFRLTTMLTLTTGTLLVVALAAVIGRFGLGHGISVVLLAGLGVDAFEQLDKLWREVAVGARTPAQLVVGLGLLVALVAATLWLLEHGRRRTRPTASGDPAGASAGPAVRLRQPLAGVVPLQMATALLGLTALLAPYGVVLRPPDWLHPGSGLYLALLVVLTGAMATGLAWLFNPAARVAEAWQASAGADARGGAAGVTADEVRQQLWRGLPLPLAWLGALVAVQRLSPIPLGTIGIAVATAIVSDLWAEWQARRLHGALEVAWVEHRLPMLEPRLAALSGAGIPAFPRAARHRALLHFFGPYLPVTVLVPAASVGAARAVLAERWPEELGELAAPGGLAAPGERTPAGGDGATAEGPFRERA